MRTKNAKAITRAESQHLERVKSLACSVCDAPAPSDAHHLKQGLHFVTIALCASCHRNEKLGWHGRRVMWAIKKMEPIDALAVTVRRLAEERAL